MTDIEKCQMQIVTIFERLLKISSDLRNIEARIDELEDGKFNSVRRLADKHGIDLDGIKDQGLE